MFNDPKKAASRARHAAVDAANTEIAAWYEAEVAKLVADDTLSDSERRSKKLALAIEVGRRANRAEGKARRDNTPAKILERNALRTSP